MSLNELETMIEEYKRTHTPKDSREKVYLPDDYEIGDEVRRTDFALFCDDFIPVLKANPHLFAIPSVMEFVVEFEIEILSISECLTKEVMLPFAKLLVKKIEPVEMLSRLDSLVIFGHDVMTWECRLFVVWTLADPKYSLIPYEYLWDCCIGFEELTPEEKPKQIDRVFRSMNGYEWFFVKPLMWTLYQITKLIRNKGNGNGK